VDETDLQLDESKLPRIGEVYWTETWIFGGSDPKPERPCVVVREPTSITDLVVVITRTSDPAIRGVQHPKDLSLD
jgi:mRNA-degrading endonuclease toxin of MazEF toxin-antitoxin module